MLKKTALFLHGGFPNAGVTRENFVVGMDLGCAMSVAMPTVGTWSRLRAHQGGIFHTSLLRYATENK